MPNSYLEFLTIFGHGRFMNTIFSGHQVLYSICLSIILCFGANSCSEKKINKKIMKNSKINFHPVTMNQSTFGREIKLRYKFNKHRCYFSDYDFLRDSAKFRKSNRALVTIEKLDDGEKLIFSKSDKAVKLTSGFLKGGIKTRYFMQDGFYGLYLCSDKIDSGTCSEKEVTHIDELSQMIYKNKVNKKPLTSDKIFYFQPLVVIDSQLYAISNYEKFQKYFAKLIVKYSRISKNEVKNITKKIYSLHTDLTNMPIEVEVDQLIINLPEMDPQN